MDRQQLGKNIFKVSHLTGEFKLRSGQISTEYFDKYRFESDPHLLKAIGENLKDLLPTNTEVLAGLELGGVPLASALGLETGLPVAFVRKAAKNYGTCQIAEGLSLSGKKVTIIEDVITTGGQVIESTASLREQGALIDCVLCVIRRSPDIPPTFKENGLQLKSLFTMEELKSLAK